MLTKILLIVLRSDQLYIWSDEYTKRIRSRTAKAPQRSCAPTASSEIDPARLPNRALQALRQARMQMRRRPRTWSQVLSFGELFGAAPANGLRTTRCLRTNSGVSGQLSPEPRDFGDDLRDQPRVAAPSRGALERRHERVAALSSRCNRHETGRCASRQYAHRLARRQPGEFVLYGGSR